MFAAETEATSPAKKALQHPRPVSPSPSLQSDMSKGDPYNFSNNGQRPVSPSPSLQTDMSKGDPYNFSNNGQRQVSPSPSLQSYMSKGDPYNFSHNGQRPVSPSPSLQSDMSKGDPYNFSNNGQSDAKSDKSKDPKDVAKKQLKKDLQKKLLEELKLHEDAPIHCEIVQQKENEKEIQPVSYGDLLKNVNRTVLMKGVAGVGKTFQTRMFMIDWAREKSNKKIDLIVSFNFSELNVRKDTSMETLLNDVLSKTESVSSYDKCKVLFILDGLEQCKLPLDFENNKILTDLKEAAPMNVLITNLIKGSLLPTAHLWIVSQPSGVDKIPPGHIQKVVECQETSERRKKLASKLKERFRREKSKAGSGDESNHPNQKNTEHIMREMSVSEVTDDEKRKQMTANSPKRVNTLADILKDEDEKTIRTALTIGEAYIGKSFHVQKFIQSWAETDSQKSMFTWIVSFFRKAKDEAELLFPLNFSELSSMKKKEVSLVGLLNHFFKETEKCVISKYEQSKVVLILDGLDSYQHPLDFSSSEILTDVRQPASVDVLLTNLIKGNLLPSAKVWITSRPPAAKQLPDDIVDRVTEIREKPDVASQRELKSQLTRQFTHVSEGTDGEKTSALLNDIYTDLYIIEGERVENEAMQVQDAKFKPAQTETQIKYCDIFKPDQKPIKTVLTTGVAGIGKSFASMKYMLDWAEGKANENIFFTFPLPFRELNLRKEDEHSFEKLLHQFFPAMKTSEITDYDKYKILIVLDGFDECRFDLDFTESCENWNNVKEPTSVSTLLANLIQGNLLPEAQIWITSPPAASNRIPATKVDRVTEVRGFNDEQKEEYFRKRFSDKELAEKVVSHVKKSRSLYIMCHIPVFCWITSKVLEDFVLREQDEGLPKTLTDMYAHFLVLQQKQTNKKYGEDNTDASPENHSSQTSNVETILSLGKLAFEELQKGNIFTEDRLKESGIDVTKATVYSGLITQIKRDGRMYQQQLFSFVHLTIQEFLAALHVQHTFSDKRENLLTDPPSVAPDLPDSDFYKRAVDKALNSEHGEWDMFLRFLLGLSLETNQDLLHGLLKKTTNNEDTNKETVQYIKKRINEDTSDPDKNLNLLYCLNELNDQSLVEEVKKYLRSETNAFESFTPAQWSALTFVLLTSDENLDLFDLKKFLKSEKVLLGMLPVVKVSKSALLSWCELTEASCSGLKSSVLSSPSSNLTMLDLSHNDLLDSGVQHLAEGLKSLHCKLEILKLSGCQVTEKGCSNLVTALESTASSPLKHLDLSYNHPGERMLAAVAENPDMKLQEVRLDHGGAHRLKPGLKKYGVQLKLNEDTASQRLVLSEDKRKVKTLEKVKERVERPKNEERFKRSQVLCDEGLEGICYWEVEWEGSVGIAVSYKDVGRKWDKAGGLGGNEMTWSLLCSNTEYIAMHGNTSVKKSIPPCQKIAVLMDGESGSLTYYSVSSSGQLGLIHTFDVKFTDLLYPAFWFQRGSITLCDV